MRGKKITVDVSEFARRAAVRLFREYGLDATNRGSIVDYLQLVIDKACLGDINEVFQLGPVELFGLFQAHTVKRLEREARDRLRGGSEYRRAEHSELNRFCHDAGVYILIGLGGNRPALRFSSKAIDIIEHEFVSMVMEEQFPKLVFSLEETENARAYA